MDDDDVDDERVKSPSNASDSARDAQSDDHSSVDDVSRSLLASVDVVPLVE